MQVVHIYPFWSNFYPHLAIFRRTRSFVEMIGFERLKSSWNFSLKFAKKWIQKTKIAILSTSRQYSTPLKLSSLVLQGKNTGFLSKKYQGARLEKNQFPKKNCQKFISFASNQAHLTIFKPDSSYCQAVFNQRAHLAAYFSYLLTDKLEELLLERRPFPTKF